MEGTLRRHKGQNGPGMDNPANFAHKGRQHERRRPHADGRHPAPPGVCLALAGQPARRVGVPAAGLWAVAAALPRLLHARRPERVRRGDLVRRAGMGRGRNGRAVNRGPVDGAGHHRGGDQRGRRPHPRVHADARALSFLRRGAPQQRVGRAVRAFSGRRVEAVHRHALPDAVRRGVHGIGRFVIGWVGDAGVGAAAAQGFSRGWR